MFHKKILFPLPSYGFDPTETAIPWKILTDRNFQVVFATPDGTKGAADEKMLEAKGLGVWKSVLPARKDAIEAYREMEKNEYFANPLKYSQVKASDFDALLLPGGHDAGVKEYLESAVLQAVVVDFFKSEKPIAAICHGVVLAARSIDPSTGKSVLYNYRTTCLLKKQEMLAYNMTKMWMGNYYRTYPEITVEDEVRAALSDSDNFETGPTPLFRDDMQHLSRGFFVKDKNYLSARWPGDAYNFSLEFVKMLLTP